MKRRSALGLLLALCVPASAGAAPVPPPPPHVSLAADGTAAVLFGDKLAVGNAGGFGPATTVTGAGYSSWVVAEPGGTARVLWVGPAADYQQPAPAYGQALFSTGPSGTQQVSGILSTTIDTSFDVASDPEGDVVATWGNAATTGAATAAAGHAFAPVAGSVPSSPKAAIADGGRTIIVGGSGSGMALRERPAGGDFGDLSPIPATDGMTPGAVAVASDGSAVVGAIKGTETDAVQRVSGTWSTTVFGNASSPQFGGAGAGVGGLGVLAFRDGTDRYVIRELPSGQEQAFAPFVGLYIQPVAMTDAGAVAALSPSGLLQHDPGQSFGGPDASHTGTTSVVRNGGGLALTGIGTQGYEVTLNGATTQLGPAPYNGGLPPTLRTVKARVPAGAVRVAHHRALVPLVCSGAGDACYGDVNGKQFSLSAEGGQYVRVPVARRAQQVSVVLTQQGDKVRVRRRVRRGPDRRNCQVAPWATRVAVEGQDQVFYEQSGSSGRNTVVACTSRVPRRVIATAAYPEAITIHNGIVAAVIGSDLQLTDVATGHPTDVPLGTQSAAAVLRLRLTDSLAAVIVDRVYDRVRIRAVVDGTQRVIDAEPGIDPDSVKVAGNTVTWTRAGAPQSTVLA